MKHLPLKQVYKEKSPAILGEKFGVKNMMAMPRITKVTINVGVGKFLKEPKRVEEIVASLETIAGQKVVFTRARKAIAGFKIRQGLEVGAMTTLRGKRMWHFLDRLVKVALPRVRDFQGIGLSAVDSLGHLNLGLKEHSVFPEIVPEKVQTLFGFQIAVTTTAGTHDKGAALFRSLGFPLRTHATINEE